MYWRKWTVTVKLHYRLIHMQLYAQWQITYWFEGRPNLQSLNLFNQNKDCKSCDRGLRLTLSDTHQRGTKKFKRLAKLLWQECHWLLRAYSANLRCVGCNLKQLPKTTFHRFPLKELTLLKICSSNCLNKVVWVCLNWVCKVRAARVSENRLDTAINLCGRIQKLIDKLHLFRWNNKSLSGFIDLEYTNLQYKKTFIWAIQKRCGFQSCLLRKSINKSYVLSLIVNFSCMRGESYNCGTFPRNIQYGYDNVVQYS